MAKNIGIPLSAIGTNLGVFGSIGSGKTNFILWLINQLITLGIVVRFWDFKGEASRLINYFRNSIVFTPQNAPWQWLEPVGNVIAYYASIIDDLRVEFEIRPETYPLVWQIFERLVRGIKPGDPFFSWEDFYRVLEHEAGAQKRENLHTVARIIKGICVALGPNACVRKAPNIDGRYSVIGYDFVGAPISLFRLFLGFHFTKIILKVQEEGHTTDLAGVDVIDEGSPLFSKELMQYGVSHISPAKRFISMSRFTGNAAIVGGQNISQTDAFLKNNIGSLVIFRCPSVEDSEEAVRLLGLPLESTDELMKLKTGEAFVRCAGWQEAVKIKVPEFKP